MCEWWIFTKPYFIWRFFQSMLMMDTYSLGNRYCWLPPPKTLVHITPLSILLTLYINIIFILLVTSFYKIVYGVTIWCKITCCFHKFSNFLLKNSPHYQFSTYLIIYLVLHKRFKIPKFLEFLILLTREIQSCHPIEIINEWCIISGVT